MISEFDMRPFYRVKQNPPPFFQKSLQGGEREAESCEGVGGVGRAQGRRGHHGGGGADDAAAGLSHYKHVQKDKM